MRVPSGEICGTAFSGLPNNTSRGINSGRSAATGTETLTRINPKSMAGRMRL